MYRGVSARRLSLIMVMAVPGSPMEVVLESSHLGDLLGRSEGNAILGVPREPGRLPAEALPGVAPYSLP